MRGQVGEQTGDRSGRLSVSLPRCSAAQGQEPRTLVKPERGGRVAAALGVCKTLRERRVYGAVGKTDTEVGALMDYRFRWG